METPTDHRPIISSCGSAWVQPIAPLEPRLIKCSAIENLCAHVYPTPTVFFPLRPGENAAKHFENLRQGLSRLIYQQPHLAGILRQDEKGAFGVEIGKGVEAGTKFWFRDLSRDPTFPSYEELKVRGFPFGDGKADGFQKLAPNPFPASENGDPVITQQLTHIKGGLVLTCSYTHLIGDLVQGRELVTQWAHHTRLVAEAAEAGKEAPPIPAQFPAEVMDRSPLTPEDTSSMDLEELKQRSTKLPNFKLIDPSDPAGTLAESQNFMPPAHVSAQQKKQQEELRQTTVGVWHFSLASLKALHHAAQQAADNDTKVSTIDVLAAFLWQRFVHAKYLPSTTDQNPNASTMVFAGDVRTRLTPPLPRAYLGAAVDLFRVSLPGASLADSSCLEPSKAIRHSNLSWDETAFRALLELSQRTPTRPGFIPKGPIDLLITDHTRATAIISADWGPGLGKTEGFREPYLGRQCPAGEVTLFPRCENGDIEVMIAGEEVTMQRLKADEVMRRASTCQFLRYDVVDAVRKSKMREVKL